MYFCCNGQRCSRGWFGRGGGGGGGAERSILLTYLVRVNCCNVLSVIQSNFAEEGIFFIFYFSCMFFIFFFFEKQLGDFTACKTFRYHIVNIIRVKFLGWTVLVLQFSVLQYTYHGTINLPWYFAIQDRVCMYSFSTDFQVQQRVCRYRKIPKVSPINTYPPPFPNPVGYVHKMATRIPDISQERRFKKFSSFHAQIENMVN